MCAGIIGPAINKIARPTVKLEKCGLGAVTMTLSGASRLRHSSTDVNGSYSFNNLPSGKELRGDGKDKWFGFPQPIRP